MEELLTLDGQPISRLGLSGQQKMEPGCVELAYQSGINYFFSYGLGKGPFVEEVRSHLAQHRLGTMVATGSESRDLGEVEASLEKAQATFNVETLDIFFAEYISPSDDWSEVEALLAQLYIWKSEGRIRYVGVSTHNRPLALRLIQESRCDVLMHRYNMAHRGAEEAVLPAAQAQGVPVIAFTSTRWGTLLKGQASWSKPVPTAADCYRFVLSHPAITLVLTSPKTLAQLQTNLVALKLPPMPQEELSQWCTYGNLIYGEGKDSFETSWP